MTATERKRLGKHWKVNLTDEQKKKHEGLGLYYEEFKSEIDAEIAAGNI